MTRRVALAAASVLAFSCVPLVEETAPPPRPGPRPGVPEIADIRSLEDLRRAQPVEIGNGWTVRLGLADGGADAGPWQLLYCLADKEGRVESPPPWSGNRGRDDVLGPVTFTCEEPGVLPEKVVWLASKMLPTLTVDGQALFCALVPTAWKGAYDIRVSTPEGVLLQERRIEMEEPRACFWGEFARLAHREEGDGRGSYHVARDATAAVPWQDGSVPITCVRGDGSFLSGERVTSGLADDEALLLPGAVAPGFGWEPWSFGGAARAARVGEGVHPLALSLREGGFVVESAVDMIDWPDRHLLARWWLDGRAVVPPRPQGLRLRENGRLVRLTRSMAVGFGLPAGLSDARPGDRVGLQVLYSPEEYRQLDATRAHRMMLNALHLPGAAAVPLLSNRLEFELTAELIELSRRNQVP